MFLFADAKGNPVAHKALLVIMDGIPADVIERVDTPGLDSISREGGYTRSYVGGEVGGETESPTISAVSYQSLLTGTWANKHNVWGNEVQDPDYGYWDVFRIAKHHDAGLKTAIFSTWEDNRTRLIGDGLPAAGGSKLDYHFDGFENDSERFPESRDSSHIRDIDAHVAAAASAYIESTGPDLTWVYLQYTDDIGHRHGDGPEQDSAVRLTDTWVGSLWQSVQARAARFHEKWLVVVTTDHGRDGMRGKDHGRQTRRERTTWIVTNSDCLTEGFYDMPAIVDILPSIVAHMNLSLPQEVEQNLDGESFIDCRHE